MRIIGIALCLLCLMCAGCSLLNGLQKPTAEITGVHVQSLSLEKAGLVMDVNVHNPYSFDLPLANLDYALSSSGAQFLSGSADLQKTVIPANGEKTIPVPVDVTFLNLLKTVQGIKPGAVVPYEADVKLLVDVPKVGPMWVPLKWSDKVPIPALPGIAVDGVKWDKVNLDEVTGVLTVRLTNTNEFPLDLEKISYGLKLGGIDVVTSELAKAVNIQSGADGTVEIPLTIDPRKFGVAIMGIMSGQKASFEMGGSLDFNTPYGKISMPFSQKGEAPFTRP